MQLFLKSLDQREHSKAKVSGRIFTFLAAEKLAYQTLMNAIKRHESPGSPMNDGLTGSQSVSICVGSSHPNSHRAHNVG